MFQYWSHDVTDKPTSTVQTNEEEEDDVEYNVLADLHSDEDYEELRNDRAVHISRKTYCVFLFASLQYQCCVEKEVDSLMEELLRTVRKIDVLYYVMIMWSQCDEDDLLTTDLDQVMPQETVPETSQTCQLTHDQSIAVCKQLQQVK